TMPPRRGFAASKENPTYCQGGQGSLTFESIRRAASESTMALLGSGSPLGKCERCAGGFPIKIRATTQESRLPSCAPGLRNPVASTLGRSLRVQVVLVPMLEAVGCGGRGPPDERVRRRGDHSTQ